MPNVDVDLSIISNLMSRHFDAELAKVIKRQDAMIDEIKNALKRDDTLINFGTPACDQSEPATNVPMELALGVRLPKVVDVEDHKYSYSFIERIPGIISFV